VACEQMGEVPEQSESARQPTHAPVVPSQYGAEALLAEHWPPELQAWQRWLPPLQMGVEPEHCLFLYVGRLEPPKDIAGLLEAFAELSRQSERAHLCMVGDGTLRPMVESAASRLPRLHYLGRLSGESLWDTYAAADVLVLPSVFEPWGLVINEAMAIGLPVIASDRVGCVEDLVVDGRTGIVVEAGSRVSLASAMLRLAEDANARASMGEAARRHIAPWTIEAEAGIVVDAWRRVARA